MAVFVVSASEAVEEAEVAATTVDQRLIRKQLHRRVISGWRTTSVRTVKGMDISTLPAQISRRNDPPKPRKLT